MYETFYGLSELPFELTANTRFLYLSAGQREALSTLEYGLFSAKSLTLLIGDAGTGKTTLLQAVLESERCRSVRCVYFNNPTLRPDDFFRLLATKFGLGAAAGESKARVIEQLETVLVDRRSRGEITALVFDEAQSLSLEMLEEIRFLANIETPSAKLLPVVLAGQPELADRLERPDLKQLKQRVTLRAVLHPFDLQETGAYIASRLTVAGGVPRDVFSLEAVKRVHEFSGGIPRTISVICDNALVSGMALGLKRIDSACVLEVCRDLQLSRNNPVAKTEAPQAPLANARVDSAPASISGRPKVAERRDDLSQETTETSPTGRFRSRLTATSRRAGRTITE